MHPVLFRIGGLTIHTYGLFVALGFLAALTFAVREAGRRSVDQQKMADLFFWVVVSAIVGSRLFYVAIEFRSFATSPLDIFKIWKGGLVFYGGFICAVAVSLIYISRRQMPLGATADIAAPAVAIGQAFGRLGCFFAGCCYGRPTDVAWAVTFTDPDSLAPRFVPLHPTQLYEAVAVLVIFFVLLRLRRVKALEGRLLWTYLLLYSGVRFVIELYRGDPRGTLLGSVLSTSQSISLFLAAAAILALVCSRRKDMHGE